MELDSQIEAVLYFKAEPVSIKEIARMLNKKENEIREGLEILKNKLQNRGLALIEERDAVELRTTPEAFEIIKEIIKEEDSKELTKSALETLSIILYKGPVRRRDIDFIRGVNSSFILRTLVSRGLIKKTTKEGKDNFYETTTELLAHLGIGSQNDLPEFEVKVQALEEKVEELVANESSLDDEINENNI